MKSAEKPDMERKLNENKQEIEEISLKELINKIRGGVRFLFSKYLIILAAGLLGGVLGFFYAKYKKPVYVAATNFVLEDADKGGGLGQYAGLASMVGVDIGGSAGGIFQGDNIIELYKSRKMIEKTLLTKVMHKDKEQLLIDSYIEINQLRDKWEDPELKKIQFQAFNSSGLPEVRPEYKRLQDSVMGEVASDISAHYLTVAKPDKKLNIITAVVTSTDEAFAKNFDDQIVKNVNDFYVQTKIKKSKNNLTILQNKTDSVRNVMNGAIYSAAAVTDETPNLNVTRQVQRIAPQQQSQFKAETNKAVLAELIKNLELSKISLLKETPLIQVIDQPVYPLEKRKTGKIKGMIMGAFLAGFLTIIALILNRILKKVMA